MKLCVQCEKENPSGANCCMYCGAVLSAENLEETARLQINLNDANATINLLKQSLITAQEQIKNNTSNINNAEIQALKNKLNAEKQRFENLIIERDNQYSKLNAQLTSLKTPKRSRWGWIFVILFIIAGIVSVGVYSQNEKLNNINSRLNAEINQLRNENTSASTVKQENISFLESKIYKQTEEIDTLRKQVPQYYRVIVSEAYCYSMLGENFKMLNSSYSDSAIVVVYSIREDHGLTQNGWINMADLEKL